MTSERRLGGGEGGSPTDSWGKDTPGRYPGPHSALVLSLPPCASLTLPSFLARLIRGSPQMCSLAPFKREFTVDTAHWLNLTCICFS